MERGDFSNQSLTRVYDLTLINTSEGLVLNPSQPQNLSLSLHQNSTNGQAYLEDHHQLDHPPLNIDLTHQIHSSNSGGHVAESPLPRISFKADRDEFWKCLQQQYNCEQSSDCLLVCGDGVRLVATLVMAAASSLIRQMLADVRRDGVDEQITIILPDVSVQDLDQLLLSLYGATTKYLDTPSKLLNMFGIDFNIGCDISEEDVIPDAELAKLKEFAMQWKSSKNTQFSTFLSYLSALFKGIVSQDLNLSRSGKSKPIRRRVGKFSKVQESAEGSTGSSSVKPEIKEEAYLDNLTVVGGGPHDDNSDMESDNNCDSHDTLFDDLDNFASSKIRGKAGHFLNCTQDHAGLYCCSVSNCRYKSGVKASLFLHGRKTHVARKYKDLCHWCSLCGEWWSNQDLFEKHKAEDDCQNVTDWPFVCEGCGRGWFNLRIYTDHLENALGDFSQCTGRPFENAPERKSCDYCPERFYSSINLTHHIKHAHKGKAHTLYECKKCQMTWKVHKDWLDHKKAHSEGGKCEFYCKISDCNFHCGKRDELSDHVNKDHPEAVHLCGICGIDYKCETSLKRHEESKHSEGRGIKKEAALYYCSKCPKYFTTKGYLNQHNLFKHSDVRAFSCEQCGKSFKSKHCVNIHLRSHGIGGQMWTCEQCGKSFKQISSYHQHLHVHSEIREFACEICGKAFKMKSNLKKHLKLHLKNPNYAPSNNDAKVYSCDICGKKFKRADNLNAHKKKHNTRSGDSQFKLIQGGNGHVVVEGGMAHVKLEGVLGVPHPQLRLTEGMGQHNLEHHRGEEMPLVLSHDPLALVDQHQQVMCDMCQWTGTTAQYIHHKKMHAYSMGFRIPGT